MDTPAAAPTQAPPSIPTNSIIARMLRTSNQVSDLILSPLRAPHVKINGELVPVEIQGLDRLTPEQTAQIAADLIGSNRFALAKLKDEGACDVSYGIPKLARLRVNVFTQRGTCAIVMRVIPTSIPSVGSLQLPPHVAQIAEIKNGVVLVTGTTGSGKSSTLAALIDLINAQKACHIVTIEDPIEFSHNHKKSIVHQRELHSDTPRFDLALRSALRQSPDVILVGEMRDKETIEIVLEAAETGHLVFSTLHTIDTSATLERLIGVFPLSDQQAVRNRFAKSFRYVISQRLIPRKDNQGRVPVLEILKSTSRTREYIIKGEAEGKSLLDAIRDGAMEGMQDFDGEIERAIRGGIVDLEAGLAFATNVGNLSLALADLMGTAEGDRSQPASSKDCSESSYGTLETELEIDRI